MIGKFTGIYFSIGKDGENLESMYLYPKDGEKIGKCLTTGKACDYKDGRGIPRPGYCDGCSRCG